jgi:hypothetical protein
MKLLSFCFLLLSFASASQASTKAPDCFPFVGEYMKYSVGWEFVNAGTAEIKISKQGVNGYKVYNFARTNGFLDMFKKVRDTIVSQGVCLGGKMQSTLFTVDQLERSYKSTKESVFLYKENKVKYTKKGKTTFFDVPAGYLNVIDAFYLTRLHPPTAGHPISIPVFDSAKKYDVVVKLLKKEKIRAPWGKRVNCLVIQPELKTAGVFSSVGTIKIWLTDDEKRIPLKITAKIKIGRIVIKMTRYKSG